MYDRNAEKEAAIYLAARDSLLKLGAKLNAALPRDVSVFEASSAALLQAVVAYATTSQPAAPLIGMLQILISDFYGADAWEDILAMLREPNQPRFEFEKNIRTLH